MDETILGRPAGGAERRLWLQARAAAAQAYAPYSGVCVGAALVTAAGATFTGVNVENASYPVGLCAERGALAAAVTSGERELRGACRGQRVRGADPALRRLPAGAGRVRRARPGGGGAGAGRRVTGRAGRRAPARRDEPGRLRVVSLSDLLRAPFRMPRPAP